MHGVDDLDVGKLLRQTAHRREDVLHGLSVVFPAVAGHCDDTLGKVDCSQLLGAEAAVADGVLHCVDDRVAGYENVARHGFPAQILRILRRRRKVQRRKAADEAAVHLLREGAVSVIGAKSRLDVSHWDLCIKRRKSCGKGRAGVAVDKHEIGLFLGVAALKSLKRTDGDVGQRLICTHYVEVAVRLKTEALHNGVEHFTVLRRDADDALDLVVLLKLKRQGRHFDGFRSRAEHRHDFKSAHSPAPPFSPSPVRAHCCGEGGCYCCGGTRRTKCSRRSQRRRPQRLCGRCRSR